MPTPMVNETPKKPRSPWTFLVGALGAILLWASLPPWNLSVLGWIAPVPWLWLARLPVLPGRRPYLALYFAGALFWALTIHWLRLPHPATYLGWFAASFYLAIYTPLIVGLTRVAVGRGISIVVAGPVLWVAADQARAYVLSGFSMSSLCHSQYRNPWIIQCADLCGEFGVTLAMVVVAASITRALPVLSTQYSVRWLYVGLAMFAAVAIYGRNYQPKSVPGHGAAPSIKLALVQGSIASEVKHDPTKPPLIYDHYLQLSLRAVEADPGVQLVVWPETMFPYPFWEISDDASPAVDETWTVEALRERGAGFRDLIAQTARTVGKPMFLGIPAGEFGPGTVRGYNSVLHVDAAGKPLARYDKQHRVMFGEYIPLADWFPWLYTVTPLTGGIEAGRRAESFTVDGIRLSPDVCYETTLARVIRRQVLELRDRGEEPDVLVNVTNDSWFRGSSELDLHVACGVFRAIEMRKPLVIAANTGFSAHIDVQGRIVERAPRGDEGIIVAQVVTGDVGPSPYLLYGDWLPWLCLAGASALAVVGLYEHRKNRKPVAAGA